MNKDITERKEFPELIGKEVHYFLPKNNKKWKPFDCMVIVAGADYNVGITLVTKDNPKVKPLCLNKIELKKRLDFPEKRYKMIFYLLIEAIQKGEIEGLEIPEVFEGMGQQSPCAFE